MRFGDRLREEAEPARSNENMVRRFVDASRRTGTILPATTTIRSTAWRCALSMSSRRASTSLRLRSRSLHPPEDAAVAAERPLPEIVGENPDTSPADGGIGSPEPPTDGRRHPEDVEEVCRHPRAPQTPGLAGIRQSRPEGAGRRDAGADLAARGPRLERPEVGGERREPILHLADADLDGDELPRIAERQRRQQHTVDEGEDRCRRPDAQPEHRDHGGGESRAAAQPPRYVAQVPDEAVEPAPPPDGTRVLPDEGEVPEPAAGRASGGIGSYADVDEPVALELHVEAHLLLEVLAGPQAAEIGNDAEEPGRPRHW